MDQETADILKRMAELLREALHRAYGLEEGVEIAEMVALQKDIADLAGGYHCGEPLPRGRCVQPPDHRAGDGFYHVNEYGDWYTLATAPAGGDDASR